MWQYVAVIIVGIITVLFILNKLFPCLFKRRRKAIEDKKPPNPCDTCAGCILHPNNRKPGQ